MNWRSDELVLCPFYVRDNATTIVCESPCEYTGLKSKLYITTPGKTDHLKKYCRCDYKDCPVYKDVIRKYE